MGTEKGRWNQTKGAVKKQWGKLTDDDLTIIAGQRDQLVGKIQERYGIAKEEADKQVKTWESMKVNVPRTSSHRRSGRLAKPKTWYAEPRYFSALPLEAFGKISIALGVVFALRFDSSTTAFAALLGGRGVPRESAEGEDHEPNE